MQELELTREIPIGELPTPTEPDEPIRILDLFCGAGGTGWALKDLFDNPRTRGDFLGVDVEDHSDTYPGQFRQQDLSETVTLADFGLDSPVDLVWASPPCTAYSRLSHLHHEDPKAVHPTFDEFDVRDMCERLGREYVIESVVGCDDLRNPIRLNGPGFGQQFVYTRLFETSFSVPSRMADPTGEEIRFCQVSENVQAQAKGVPQQWGKYDIRAALPGVYIGYLVSHCPTLTDITPFDAVRGYQQTRTDNEQQTLRESI